MVGVSTARDILDELEAAAAWYEREREGYGELFMDEVEAASHGRLGLLRAGRGCWRRD